jgi:hypothetical protein
MLRQPQVRKHQRVQHHRQRAEHHHRGHRDRHLVLLAAHHGLRGHHGGRAADGAARADQRGGLPVEPQPARAHVHRHAKGQRDHGRGDHQARPADRADVVQRDAKAVQHDARAQQRAARKVHARAGAPRHRREHRVARHHAQRDGQRERAEAQLRHRVPLREQRRHARQQQGQQQPRCARAGERRARETKQRKRRQETACPKVRNWRPMSQRHKLHRCMN